MTLTFSGRNRKLSGSTKWWGDPDAVISLDAIFYVVLLLTSFWAKWLEEVAWPNILMTSGSQ